jgi:predicted O-methyltransferase YrrM
MSLLDRVRRRIVGPTRIVKPSAEAVALSWALRTPNLDPKILAAVNVIRERMRVDSTPWVQSYGGFRTVGEHFSAASSRDENLAMLQALVRHRRAMSVLEIGAAYGVSGTAIVMAQERAGLVTIEGFEPQATFARQNLPSTGIEIVKAEKDEAIAGLASEDRRFDLVFHDGGHAGDYYVNDFNAIYPMLARPATFIVDNIYHDDGARREVTRPLSRRTCREGWEELVADPRVSGAVVYRNSVGILLTR